jgi:hypothetical protein
MLGTLTLILAHEELAETPISVPVQAPQVVTGRVRPVTAKLTLAVTAALATRAFALAAAQAK